MPNYTFDQFFIGRDKESKLLGRQFNECLDLGSRVVLVSGETGTGKTTLLHQLKDNVLARDGYYLLCKNGPLGTSFPYQPIAEILRVLIDKLDHNFIKQVISNYPPLILSELALMVPKFLGLTGNALKGYAYSNHLPDKLFLENACTIIQELLGQTPVVLVVEDIPYADPTSLEVLQYFVQHSDEFRILVCATCDLDDIDLSTNRFNPFRNFVRQLSYDHTLIKLQLSPHSKEETEQLVCSLLNTVNLPPGLGDVLYEKSEGNPLAAKHLVEKLLEEGYLREENNALKFEQPKELALPKEIQEIYLLKLERIGPELTNVLAAAALIGRKFTARNLAKLLELPITQVLSQLEEAVKLKLIEEHWDLDHGYFTFLSSGVQEVLYEGISHQRRVLLHKQVGTLLEKDTEYKAHPDELLYHFQWADEKEKALHYAVIAGQKSISLCAFHNASRCHKIALELLPFVEQELQDHYRCAVLQGLAESLSFLGCFSEARHYLNLLLEAQELQGTPEYASVRAKLGDLCFRTGDFSEALEHYNLALQYAGEREKCSVVNGIINTYVQLGRFEDAEALAELQLIKAQGSNDDSLTKETMTLLTFLYIYDGQIKKAVETSKEVAKLNSANAMAQLSRDMVIGLLAMEHGPAAVAETYLKSAADKAKKIQDPLFSGQVLTYLARLYILKQNYAGAEELLEKVKASDVFSDSFFLRANVSKQETLLVLLGQKPLTQSFMRDLEELLQQKDSTLVVQALARSAELAAAAGRVEPCKQTINDVDKFPSHSPRNKVYILRGRAACNLAAGNSTAAGKYFTQAVEVCLEQGMHAEGLITCLAMPMLCTDTSKGTFMSKLELKSELRVSKPSTVEVKENVPCEVSQVLEYIHTNIAADLNMNVLCRVANLSERQLRRLFTQYAGTSIKEYINLYRIERAKELLANPTLGISEVGEMVGMCDKSHFSKTFKSLVGESPTVFRKNKLLNVRNNKLPAAKNPVMTD